MNVNHSCVTHKQETFFLSNCCLTTAIQPALHKWLLQDVDTTSYLMLLVQSGLNCLFF